MPSTHVSLHYHLIWSTKIRQPMIREAWQERLHAFLGGAVRTVGGVPLAVGGMCDHVHLLIGLRATHTLSEVVRDIKHSSSQWVHETLKEHGFAWQDGYGAFTVSASQIATVKEYIGRQVEHHRKLTFQDEYRSFLQQSGVDYDERFLP